MSFKKEVSELSQAQKKALLSVLKGENIFISGAGGSGKSHLIKLIRRIIHDKYPQRLLYITSSTGVSAINISGMTVHSFAGIGTGEHDHDVLLKRVQCNPEARARWKDTDILIIDEISMISCELFEKLDYIARKIRKSELPFGGLQLVLFGDFYQLTPVLKEKPKKVFAFESEVWDRVITKVIYLTKIFRQTDHEYRDILNRMRKGRQTWEDLDKIKTRISGDYPDNTIKLFPTNKLVKQENMRSLKKLSGASYKYKSQYKGDLELRKELENQFLRNNYCDLELRIGARVMLTYNLDVPGGLCNGSLGTCVGFKDGLPIVQFDPQGTETLGKTLKIDRNRWTLEKKTKCFDENGLDDYITKTAYAEQVPLILAWACSIHKAQGLTFDRAVVSLRDCFADHQIYVALSRVKTLDGLTICEDFGNSKITVNKKVRKNFK